MSLFIYIPCERCGAVNRVLIERMAGKPKCARCKHMFYPGAPLNVNSEQFQRVVLQSGLPVLVDFWAPWCGPCKSMAPVIEDIARRYSQSVLVVKVNTDQAPELSERYAIRGVPTMILFQDGQERFRQVGAVPPQTIESMLMQARM